jgi:hypothetical protein
MSTLLYAMCTLCIVDGVQTMQLQVSYQQVIWHSDSSILMLCILMYKVGDGDRFLPIFLKVTSC